MPFTPFHLGSALFFGMILRLNLLTFIIANVILDIEPFIVLLFGLKYPLHGFFHTFIGASIVAALLSLFMSKALLKTINIQKIVISSFLGVYSHIILDSPLYSDIKPFYPLSYNPFYNVLSMSEVYNLCVFLFILGIVIYLLRKLKY